MDGRAIRLQEMPSLPAAEYDLAATHRSLWLGSRPRPATGSFFCLMKSKILLVDDDPAVRWMLLRVLEEEGYLVLAAGNSTEALEMASTKSPDLALLDLALPVEDGWKVFQQLASNYPLVQVVIITARPNQLFPALASGVGALMEKPLDLPRLLRTIQDLLEEPAETRMARAAGRPAEFHYQPPKSQALTAAPAEEHAR
jgi:CheY-like chemotaxis protein